MPHSVYTIYLNLIKEHELYLNVIYIMIFCFFCLEIEEDMVTTSKGTFKHSTELQRFWWESFLGTSFSKSNKNSLY